MIYSVYVENTRMCLWVNAMKRLLSLILSALTALVLCVLAIAAADPIRVGLYFGNDALPTANLANEVGSGYQFGYYDTDDNFIDVGSAASERITVCKDRNFYFSGGSFSEQTTDGTLIGAYHLQLNETFSNFGEAVTAAAAYPYGFPAYIDGAYRVRFEFYSSAENAASDAVNYYDVSVVGNSATCYTVVNTADGTILFEFDCHSDHCLAILPDITGTTSPETWFKGYLYNGGFEYNRRLGNDITVVNVVSENDYLCGVLPQEFVCSGGIESLKAAACAARTFACQQTKHRSLGFDVCTTTNCQVYRGVYKRDHADKIRRAVEETEGVKIYYNGSLIQAVYHASSGGKLESAYNTWQYGYPYLIAQEDPYESSITFNSKNWRYTVTSDQIRTMLERNGYHLSAIQSMDVTKRTEIGNVDQVVITDFVGGKVSFSHDNVRTLSGISGVGYFSRNFSIVPNYVQEAYLTSYAPVTVQRENGTEQLETVSVISAKGEGSVNSTDAAVLTDKGVQQLKDDVVRTVKDGYNPISWTFVGSGYGHNVGLSQWGAYAMAQQGKTYEEILAFYYPGTTLR